MLTVVALNGWNLLKDANLLWFHLVNKCAQTKTAAFFLFFNAPFASTVSRVITLTCSEPLL